jgi:hypothetical protein
MDVNQLSSDKFDFQGWFNPSNGEKNGQTKDQYSEIIKISRQIYIFLYGLSAIRFCWFFLQIRNILHNENFRFYCLVFRGKELPIYESGKTFLRLLITNVFILSDC